MKIDLTWTEFKSLLVSKNLFIQYIKLGRFYKIWMQEDQILYITDIYFDNPTISDSDQEDFELNYKSLANAPTHPTDFEGKTIVRSESRPLGYTTSFTCIGDTTTGIGGGKELFWDFSNEDDLLSFESGSPTKTKRIEFGFYDDIYLKEGTVYFDKALKGSYVDIKVVCPTGFYYLNNPGVPTQAQEDTIVHQYLMHHFICGSCNMGDELNTESCSSKIPKYMKYWIDVTVPVTDEISTGHVSVELYRTRTVIL